MPLDEMNADGQSFWEDGPELTLILVNQETDTQYSVSLQIGGDWHEFWFGIESKVAEQMSEIDIHALLMRFAEREIVMSGEQHNQTDPFKYMKHLPFVFMEYFPDYLGFFANVPSQSYPCEPQ